MHIWVDFDRASRTHPPAGWFPLKNYIIYDWLASCPFFKKIFVPSHDRTALTAARRENYAIIVSLCGLRAHRRAGRRACALRCRYATLKV
jgi:hypothetical protein